MILIVSVFENERVHTNVQEIRSFLSSLITKGALKRSVIYYQYIQK